MKCYKCQQDTNSYICRQCEREEAIKAKEKRDEEFLGDDHEFYESCYVPERDC